MGEQTLPLVSNPSEIGINSNSIRQRSLPPDYQTSFISSELRENSESRENSQFQGVGDEGVESQGEEVEGGERERRRSNTIPHISIQLGREKEEEEEIEYFTPRIRELSYSGNVEKYRNSQEFEEEASRI